MESKKAKIRDYNSGYQGLGLGYVIGEMYKGRNLQPVDK